MSQEQHTSKLTPADQGRMSRRTSQQQIMDTLRELQEAREASEEDVPDADDSSVKAESLR